MMTHFLQHSWQIKLKEDGEAVSKKHKFLVRVFNTKASVAGDQVVTVEYKRRRKNAKNVSVEALHKLKHEVVRKNVEMNMRKKKWNIYPFIIGGLLVALFASYEISSLSSTSKMFISYLIGQQKSNFAS